MRVKPKISYNGQAATLTNEKGTINAATPEELLRATGVISAHLTAALLDSRSASTQ
ncbi:MAG: hypothetical protein U1E91_01570 [Moraxella sp.]